jgi:hypothetical protein
MMNEIFLKKLIKNNKIHSVVIEKLLNASMSKPEIYESLLLIYPDKDMQWAKTRLRTFESAYGFMGFFDTNTSDDRNNVIRENINKNELNAYLESNKITQEELISLYEKVHHNSPGNIILQKRGIIFSFFFKKIKFSTIFS